MQAFCHDVNVSCSILLMLSVISFVFSIKRTLMRLDVGRLQNVYPMQWNAAGAFIWLLLIVASWVRLLQLIQNHAYKNKKHTAIVSVTKMNDIAENVVTDGQTKDN